MFDKTTQSIDQTQNLSNSELIKFFTGDDKGKLLKFTGGDFYVAKNDILLVYKKQIISVQYDSDKNRVLIRYIGLSNDDNGVKGCIQDFIANDSLDAVMAMLE